MAPASTSCLMVGARSAVIQLAPTTCCSLVTCAPVSMPRSTTHTSSDTPKRSFAFLDLTLNGSWIGGIAPKRLDGDRVPGVIGEQAKLDLRFTWPPVPRVAPLGRRAVLALHVGQAEVVQHHAPRLR